MRKSLVFYLNGDRQELTGARAFGTVSDFLRYGLSLSGTKVVCAEGDCGACTVLLSRFDGKKMGPYLPVNSCIAQVSSLDQCHLITIEGLKKDGLLHPAQDAMAESQGAQCGFCTPGMVCALAGLSEESKISGKPIDEVRARNHLTGNLCRCTGYEPILRAATAMDLKKVEPFRARYPDATMTAEFLALSKEDLLLEAEGLSVHAPGTWMGCLEVRKAIPGIRIVSGSTDLGVVKNKGKIKLDCFLTLSRVVELSEIRDESDWIRIGARADLSSIERAVASTHPEFSRLLRIFASPQIKNAATLAGNLINASPIGDTIPFLRVSEAVAVLSSLDGGERRIEVDSFLQPGYKKLDIRPEEILLSIEIPKTRHRYRLYKASNRRDLDISAATFAARYEVVDGCLRGVRMALGGVGPTVLRMASFETQLEGHPLRPGMVDPLVSALSGFIQPLSDVRGSKEHRMRLCRNFLYRFQDELLREAGAMVSGVSV